jgi:hypothetical protein
MNTGKTHFAQVMEFVLWKTFSRIIARHNGDAGTRTLSSAELFRILASRSSDGSRAEGAMPLTSQTLRFTSPDRLRMPLRPAPG